MIRKFILEIYSETCFAERILCNLVTLFPKSFYRKVCSGKFCSESYSANFGNPGNPEILYLKAYSGINNVGVTFTRVTLSF